MKKGLSRFKNLFWYSDSEPSEITIAICNLFALPAAIIGELDSPSAILIMVSLMCGAYQLWAVLWSCCIKHRLLAVQIASLLSVAVLINLYTGGIIFGSSTVWVVMAGLAFWNTARVFNEKIEKGL